MYLHKNLEQFRTIELAQIREVELLHRRDTKYFFNLQVLENLLPRLHSQYRIVKIENRLVHSYQTDYYDTADFSMFHQHLNGKLHRYKIRTRTYLNSNLSFIEVKTKNNKAHTFKKRRKLNPVHLQKFIEKHTPFAFSQLEKKITVYYSRITLVDNDLTQRITVDTDLMYKTHDAASHYPNLVIFELKADRNNIRSQLSSLLREIRVFPRGLSKYCLGIATHYPQLKINRYKAKIRELRKVM